MNEKSFSDSFAMCFQNRIVGYSHSLVEVDPSGVRRTTSWLELFDDPPLGMRFYRRKSLLISDREGPISLEGCDSYGNVYSLSKFVFSNMETVLESNMIGQLADAIRIRNTYLPSGFLLIHAFLADGGRCFDIKIKKEGNIWKSNLNENIEFDKNGNIIHLKTSSSGIYFKKTHTKLPDWVPKDENNSKYVAHKGIIQREVTIGPSELSGTLAEPKETPFASAVFIGGSGRYDRHGATAGFDLGYGSILDGLARRGLRSLRYERYKDSSEAPDFRSFIDGAKEAFSMIESVQSGDEPLLLVGHSLGGLIALMAAHELTSISALVLISTPGRPIDDIIGQQIEWILKNGGYTSEQGDAVRHLRVLLEESIREKRALPAELLDLERQLDYLRDLAEIEPTSLASRIDCPVLIFSCENDVQVSFRDAELLAASIPHNVQHEVIDLKGVNHLLQTSPKNERNAIWNYSRHKVEEDTLDIISRHITRFIKNTK